MITSCNVSRGVMRHMMITLTCSCGPNYLSFQVLDHSTAYILSFYKQSFIRNLASLPVKLENVSICKQPSLKFGKLSNLDLNIFAILGQN